MGEVLGFRGMDGSRGFARWLQIVVVALVCVVAATAAGAETATAQVGFGKSVLGSASSSNPTSIQFGPDGRLYAAQMDGVIKAYTISRNGANDYAVTGTETIAAISAIPNHDDDGTLNASVKGRLVTGIVVAGTVQKPVIYVTSSDPRIGGGPSGNNTDLDTNSGIISRLTRSGSSWIHEQLVRGLPRSEENHTANGMALVGSTLYVGQGGNTNNGGPSLHFANLPEYALAAAILSVDLAALPVGQPYDIPTLTGSGPFGGNEGLNQTKIVPGGPVKVHAPGFRNPYDVVYTKSGKLYSIDNGGNANWGNVPQGEGPAGTCTNAPNQTGGPTERDSLHLIDKAGYYGGHPNPTRASTANTFGGKSPVPAGNPVECDWRSSGTASGSGNQEGSLTSFDTSTNGLTEYTASNFGGALKGDLLTVDWDRKLWRVDLNAAGTAATKSTLLLASVPAGGTPLDVTAVGDDGPFPGTIWYGDFINGDIYVLEPNDFSGAVVCDLSKPDADGDGFTNADEEAAGTNACSAADVPPDVDGDRIPDRRDPDDDNDGLADLVDPFALDAANGLKTTLPVNYQWENDSPPAGWLLNLGFTGLMTNGTTDYLDQFRPEKMTVIGAAGNVTVDEAGEGDAFGKLNTQTYGFQFGVNAAPSVGPFVAHTRLTLPFSGMKPEGSQSFGLFLGTGDQDNYFKVVATPGGIEALNEVGSGVSGHSKAQLALPGPDAVDLYLTVDPAAGTVTPSFTSTSGGATSARTTVGSPQSVPRDWFTACTGLAVGIISTSAGPAPPFPATWDFIEVQPAGASAGTPPATRACAPGSGGGQGGARDTTAPSITNLRLRPTRIRSTRRGATISAAKRARLNFKLSESARVRYVVQRVRAGSYEGDRCVTRRVRRPGFACTRYVPLRGSVERSHRAGDVAVAFRGRMRGRRLKPGRYRLVLRAVDAAGNRSASRSVRFRIVRR